MKKKRFVPRHKPYSVQNNKTERQYNLLWSHLLVLHQDKYIGFTERAPDLLCCKLYQNKAQKMLMLRYILKMYHIMYKIICTRSFAILLHVLSFMINKSTTSIFSFILSENLLIKYDFLLREKSLNPL